VSSAHPPGPHREQGDSEQGNEVSADAPLTTCSWHPERPTGLRCTRCGRPACPECLREASVGYQCVHCVHEGRRSAPRRPVTVAGAALGNRLVIVPALIGLNLLVYLVTVVQSRSLGSNSGAPLFFDWALLPPAVASGELWRLFTSGFLHYGPLHLAFNMYALWVIGRDMELVLGRLRFSAVYLVSLFGGSVSVFLLGAPQEQVAGASGAVFGLMGGIAVAAVRLRLNPGPALGVIALNVVISVTLPGISLLGHLGGLVVGAAATAGMVYAPARHRAVWQAGTLVALAVALVALGVLRYQQFASL
jgi:membrane associated rhomboid family serine protease